MEIIPQREMEIQKLEVKKIKQLDRRANRKNDSGEKRNNFVNTIWYLKFL